MCITHEGRMLWCVFMLQNPLCPALIFIFVFLFLLLLKLVCVCSLQTLQASWLYLLPLFVSQCLSCVSSFLFASKVKDTIAKLCVCVCVCVCVCESFVLFFLRVR